jgi:hypothetical protein
LRDILQGDNSLRDREEYSYLNFAQIRTALQWVLDNNLLDEQFKSTLLQEPWRLNFKSRPPSPEEFLTEKYIGPMAETLWYPMKQAFIEFFNPISPYRTALLVTSIGSGKSTLTILINLYVAVCFALMWSPHRFFSMSPTTIFVSVFCAVSQKKSSETLFEPLQQLLEVSPFFQKVRTHAEMKAEEHRLHESSTVDYIPWTTSTPSSVMDTGGGLHWKLIASANSLLGMNILIGSMTELSFFQEAGWSDQRVQQFFTKLRQRITNRFKNNYYARFVLDSSPNTLENFPDSYVWSDATKNHENFIWTGSRWKLYPEEFPDFITIEDFREPDEKITEHHNFDVGFMLYKGANGKLPFVIENEGAASSFEPVDCIWCPKKQVATQGSASFLDKALENPIEFMRDIAGIPAGSADRIFYEPEKIEACFTNGLRNIYGAIRAPAMENPEHLIWDQVSSMFFYKIMDRYYYYYAPEVARCVSVDQSKSRDVTCIAMSHAERDMTRVDPITKMAMTVYVTDFTIYIVPKGGLINLDAIKFFIYDLRRLGNLNIKHVAFDGYQSDPTTQFLKRHGFETNYVSVDANNDSYMTFIDLVFKNRWFCGKNIFMKNNMKSLHMEKRKISGSVKVEHFKGDLVYDWTGDWATDLAGVNAKDGCDAVASNMWLMGVYSDHFPATHTFNPDEVLDRSYESIKKKSDSMLSKMSLMRSQ